MPNAMLVGDKSTPDATPVPVRESVPFTVPEIVKVAARDPLADGVKVKSTVQEAAAAIVPPFEQVPVPALAKLAAFVPVKVKYGVLSVSVAVPTLLTVIVSGELVVFTF